MRGIKKGASTDANKPVLVLYARSGGFLKDVNSASYVIEDITGSTPTTVTSGTVDTTADRLGLGRYYAKTGSTSSWNTGTHRVIFTYDFTSGGESYTQVHEFEVLDANDWPDDTQFVAYASSKRVLSDGYVPSSTSTTKVQNLICLTARQIERWTKQFFDPRWKQLDLTNRDAGPALFLDHPIVALEKVESVVKQSDGTLDLTEISSSVYDVYNRHLRGLLEPDDRKNPKLKLRAGLITADGSDPIYGQVKRWPTGSMTIRVTGVVGYTDPPLDPDDVNIGETPLDIRIVNAILTSRYNEDPTMSSLGTWSPGLVKKISTRDQEIQFASSSGNVSFAGGLSGDPTIDQRLLPYVSPPKAVFVERSA